MKTSPVKTLAIIVILLTASQSFAQKASVKIDTSNIRVQRLTFMERFEPESVISMKQRMAQKKERIAETEWKIGVIDTLDISERKRRLLFKDLKHNPHSNRLQKATATTSFEDDADDNTEN